MKLASLFLALGLLLLLGFLWFRGGDPAAPAGQAPPASTEEDQPGPAELAPQAAAAGAPSLPAREALPSAAAAAGTPSPLKALRARFDEEALRGIALRSLAVEDEAREALGETEEAYAQMQRGWAALCQELRISEAERDALEDEALRRGWLEGH